MAICIQWAQIKGADVSSYRLYRSIVGFTAVKAQGPAIDGLDLILDLNRTGDQTFTFNDIDDAVTTINQTIEGGHAFDSFVDGNAFLLRSDLRDENGSVEIVGGTALNALGITPRVITEQSEELLLETIAAPDDQAEIVGYTDLDGAIEDWYRVTTIASTGAESRPSAYEQAAETSGALCRVEGVVTDLQGVRIPDAIISAEIMDFDQSVVDPALISTRPLTTLSGVDGRWVLPLLQRTLVQLKIDAVGYNESVIIPDKAWIEITELQTTQEHRWRQGMLP